ncbi:restriction endonuclease subunit S [Streptomyces brevispora]|uniref:restriction endonuclease subunit S n=1 Tax=Streptomyces brevispora TaxID=887462 RepID=UPI0035D7BDDA
MTNVDHWIHMAPTQWTRGRLKNLIASASNGTWGTEPEGDGSDVHCIRAADFDRTRRRARTDQAPLRSIDASSLRNHKLQPGDLVLEKSGGGEKQPVGMAVLFEGPGKAVCSNFCARISPDRSADSRFLTYVFAAAYSQGLTQSAIKQTTGIQNLDASAFLSASWAYPGLDEQRRIADFLDAETARIDQLITARASQNELLDLLLGQLIDGAVIGAPETLEKLGVPADSSTWGIGKTSRLCEVIPGYAFPSEGFSHDSGMRLLRGVNVSVDKTSWGECVWWDETSTPTPRRFHLRTGDLVIGMDRPWISSGTRITFINEEDLPALLLQRVACLRPKSPGIDMDFVYWNLRSSHFRRAVEGELTGVSVPHLSGDQIGSFSFPLPDTACQKRISDRLTVHSARIRELRSRMTRQTKSLAERRQALITAAVTGQFDVSTASGRNVTDGVSA